MPPRCPFRQDELSTEKDRYHGTAPRNRRCRRKLIKLLAERQRLVEAVIAVKQREGMPARVPARVDYVIDRARVFARAHHLDPALAESIWTEMVEWFVAHEERTLDLQK